MVTLTFFLLFCVAAIVFCIGANAGHSGLVVVGAVMGSIFFFCFVIAGIATAISGHCVPDAYSTCD